MDVPHLRDDQGLALFDLAEESGHHQEQGEEDDDTDGEGYADGHEGGVGRVLTGGGGAQQHVGVSFLRVTWVWTRGTGRLEDGRGRAVPEALVTG